VTIKAVHLRTEYKINPEGIDVAQPRLSWLMQAEDQAVTQAAYRIMAASSPELLSREAADLWDSGKVYSDESNQIVYQGKALYSREPCYWKVKVWDANGRESEWSEDAYWSMGLLSNEEWNADWIDVKRDADPELLPCGYVRKEFALHAPVQRATVYSTALGDYALYLNGWQINDRFAPGWTDYAHRLQYQAYDVTECLKSGNNAVGMIIGAGWYAGTVGMSGTRWYGQRPSGSMLLYLEYENGTLEIIRTDRSWKASPGPLLYSDHIMGERYDARLEHIGWTEPGFDDTGWDEPEIFPRYPGKLVAQVDPPVRITQIMQPVQMIETDRGTYIFDMGQNMVGWAELRVKGEPGVEVSLSYAEMLKPDGTLYIENLREAKQQDYYILRGEEQGEVYEPQFTFHGFRYVELNGYPGTPSKDAIAGKVVHSDTPQVGSFACSHEMINQLHSNICWGQRGNFLSVPTDCPQRDERLGWLGDAQIFMRTASYNRDVSSFFTKYMYDITDAQHPNGAFTDVAPDGGWIWYKTKEKEERWLAPDNAGWGDAGVIIPWTMYLVYRDTRILEQNYLHMEKWMEYLKRGSANFIRPDYGDYGDWLSINSVTPNKIVGTAYFAYDAKLMAQIAEVLGKHDDAQKYRQLFKKVREAFNREFIDEEGRILGNSQTVYILALRFGLLEGVRKQQGVRHLVNDLKAQDNHLTTGFLGVGHLLPVLSEHHCDEMAYALLKQDTFPSWLYPIKQGATTIWERWDSWTDKGFGPPRTNSMNHYALGSVGEWLYRYMAGIDTDPSRPGYKHSVIRPRIGGGLTFAKAEYNSIYGLIRSAWTIKGGTCELEVWIPANTTADVYIPWADTADIIASDGAEFGETTGDGSAQFRIGSGAYHFYFPISE